MALFTRSLFRRKDGGITKTQGGTAGSFSSRSFGEGISELPIQSNETRSHLNMWANGDAAPEHLKARQTLLEELEMTVASNDCDWEAANDFARQSSVPAEEWLRDPWLMPFARAAAEIQMIAQEKMHEEGRYIRDLECRQNWVQTFVNSDHRTLESQFKYAFPRQSPYNYQNMDLLKNNDWSPQRRADLLASMGEECYDEEVYQRAHDYAPATPYLGHFDDLVAEGTFDLLDFEYKEMSEELDGAHTANRLKYLHKSRLTAHLVYEDVDMEKLAVGTPAGEKWKNIRLNALHEVETADRNINNGERRQAEEYDPFEARSLAEQRELKAKAEDKLESSRTKFPHKIDHDELKPGVEVYHVSRDYEGPFLIEESSLGGDGVCVNSAGETISIADIWEIRGQK